MTSIPQLKADINELQGKLSAALARVAELESMPERVVTITETIETVKTVHVPIERTRVEYVDNPDLVAKIRELQSRVRG